MELAYRDITYLPGVGTKRAEILKKELGVKNALDLLYIFPYKYIDRSRFWKIREIQDEDTYVQIIGIVRDWHTIGVGKAQRLSAEFFDGENTIELVWFKGVSYVRLERNVQYLMFGKPTAYNHQYNIVHPELELLSKVNLQTKQGLEPHYNTSEKMKSSSLNSRVMRKIMAGLMPDLKMGIPDTLGSALLEHYHLMPLTDSLVNIHFPKDMVSMKKARERLKFEELFYIQLQILRQSRKRNLSVCGFRMSQVGESFHTFYSHYLPFPLTNAQKRVIKEIHADMKSGKQMNRLLQGDVGSGKTLVALMCALLAKDNGYQSCIMAPTEILANQHYETVTAFLKDLNVRVGLLTGSTTAKQRNQLHEALQRGEIDILIGTHALLEDTVQFSNLGLVLVDEQHRFGVAQRARLWAKNVQPPHVLVMTATPIPRTLAMTVYGDLSVSVIDELPPGRKPIRTLHYTNRRRREINEFIRTQIEGGRQVYVVYPLIEENKKMDLADLESGYQTLCQTFPQYRISMVHGKMRASDKDEQMRRFAQGETQILVATTVIEVGVNVPNASVMIVENAERFGLSQLHQLRGRVGRGAEQSYCILLTNVELSRDTRKRMDIMVATNDGFRIAEADLQLRGPGDLEGTQQSGLPFELKIASLSTDGQLLEVAREAANAILDKDPELTQPENALYVAKLNKLKQRAVDWTLIS
ncbi:MAG: ATP-dependent DNA helicase RecG [Paludibacter sp.]|nr:ATP-dependent DNA helicase RecG [Bacteroidales bacterium]MCM1068393.1 ATP-dependent DNA helicase RecG [Prevotella sp.]MCM1354751.1 ATP-dependent DNA helicase RecG [Bacteroides sp.]MCM1442160.1 ATP-dependent DNA helicase RecG [Muribaculum sp.]MCM1482415.1 ATP-dependent DNA helicase RecG [Paludibacter sp.]